MSRSVGSWRSSFVRVEIYTGYFDMSGEEHAEFLAAESKGTYLNHVFKLRDHRYLVVRKCGN